MSLKSRLEKKAKALNPVTQIKAASTAVKAIGTAALDPKTALNPKKMLSTTGRALKDYTKTTIPVGSTTLGQSLRGFAKAAGQPIKAWKNPKDALSIKKQWRMGTNIGKAAERVMVSANPLNSTLKKFDQKGIAAGRKGNRFAGFMGRLGEKARKKPIATSASVYVGVLAAGKALALKGASAAAGGSSSAVAGASAAGGGSSSTGILSAVTGAGKKIMDARAAAASPALSGGSSDYAQGRAQGGIIIQLLSLLLA